jgi:hypothetical protein
MFKMYRMPNRLKPDRNVTDCCNEMQNLKILLYCVHFYSSIRCRSTWNQDQKFQNLEPSTVSSCVSSFKTPTALHAFSIFGRHHVHFKVIEKSLPFCTNLETRVDEFFT